MPKLKAEREMACAMLDQFGAHAAQHASDNAHQETLTSNNSQAAYWRRVTALIVDFHVHPPREAAGPSQCFPLPQARPVHCAAALAMK